MTKSNFLENSMCDYITDLEKKLSKAPANSKPILAGKVADAKRILSQCLGSVVHNVHFTEDNND